MDSGFSYAILFSLSPFHPNLKRHLRIRRFVIVPNVHLIAFWCAQHDEVDTVGFVTDVIQIGVIRHQRPVVSAINTSESASIRLNCMGFLRYSNHPFGSTSR